MKKILYLLYKIKVWLLYCCCSLFSGRGKYKDLVCYKNVFGVSKYVRARESIFCRVEKKKNKKHEKRIRIVMVDCCEWCTEDIYHYFKSKGVDVGVIIVPFFHGTEDSIRKAYDLCREFCETRNLSYYEVYNPGNWGFMPERWTDAKGDVLIYTNSWLGSYPKEIRVNNLPLSTITCYIPYGFMLEKGEEHEFNQGSHNMFTHIYCESKAHLKMFAEYCDIGDSHVEFSGHPKMDFYIVPPKCIEENIIWRVNEKCKATKIIYSPHWNFDAGHATFRDNGIKILEYAEAHPDTTSWVYKPHPLLEKELIVKGYMSAQEYKTYIKRWENLPNARVYLSGDYGDIFITSDCMINDSISFIAEYMYTHKPMLLLLNDSTEFNQFGQKCVENVYTCKGCDFEAIVRFIENVSAGVDVMKDNREKFFKENLDYYYANGKSASEYIVSQISDMIGI